MIAGRDDHTRQLAQPDQRGLQQRHRLQRRERAVVHVAGDQNGVHLFGPHRLDQMVEERRVGRPQVDAVQRAPEVPVGGVQNPHARTLRTPTDKTREAGPDADPPGPIWGRRRPDRPLAGVNPCHPRQRPPPPRHPSPPNPDLVPLKDESAATTTSSALESDENRVGPRPRPETEPADGVPTLRSPPWHRTALRPGNTRTRAVVGARREPDQTRRLRDPHADAPGRIHAHRQR